MYKCRDCGEVFKGEEAGVYYNPCPYGERIVYEELDCCPNCESGRYEEISEEEDDDEYDDESET
jgi:hypothetical protein